MGEVRHLPFGERTTPAGAYLILAAAESLDDIARAYARCDEAGRGAETALLARLPDKAWLLGVDLAVEVRATALGYGPDPGPPPDADGRAWVWVVATPERFGWVRLADAEATREANR